VYCAVYGDGRQAVPRGFINAIGPFVAVRSRHATSGPSEPVVKKHAFRASDDVCLRNVARRCFKLDVAVTCTEVGNVFGWAAVLRFRSRRPPAENPDPPHRQWLFPGLESHRRDGKASPSTVPAPPQILQGDGNGFD
jgi:hypothetical protein